jgi:hypothetical protein
MPGTDQYPFAGRPPKAPLIAPRHGSARGALIAGSGSKPNLGSAGSPWTRKARAYDDVEMNIRPLLEAIVAALLLLEDTSDEDLDPDVAVRGMEEIAHSLNQLSVEDRSTVRRMFEKIAISQGPPYADFIRAIPGSIGWDDDAGE